MNYGNNDNGLKTSWCYFYDKQCSVDISNDAGLQQRSSFSKILLIWWPLFKKKKKKIVSVGKMFWVA